MKLDFVFEENFSGAQVFAAQSIGRRQAQEDFFTILEVPEISFLNIDGFLKQAFQKAHNATKDLLCGSVAIVAYISNDFVCLAHLGDSTAILFQRFNGSNHFSSMKLVEPHLPHHANERKRIEKAGGLVHEKRLQGKLAMSRCFGNADIPHISIKPYIATILSAIPKSQLESSYLALFSDGIFENKFNRRYCSSLLSKQSERTNLASAIVEKAFEYGSRDNLTAILVDILNGPNQNTNLLIGIYDGHRGDSAAKLVKQVIEYEFLNYKP